MKLSINKEYLQRHLFVTVLMAGLGCWFGYDGFVKYPQTPAVELYRSIEKSDPPESLDLEAFKRQKTQTQYGFTLLSLLAALVVGFRLYRSAKFAFEFDDDGFTCKGRRHAYGEVKSVNRSKWEKDSILTVVLESGEKIVLDGWHHSGVREFESRLPKATA